MRFHNWIDMRSGVDEQSLTNIFDCQRSLIIDVKFVETLRNYLIQVLIEQLSDSCHGIVKREAFNIIFLKELSYSDCLIFSKFFNQTITEIFNRDLKGLRTWILSKGNWIGRERN